MTNLRAAAIALAASSSAALLGTVRAQSPISVHGSGTTNPSKCFWHIMAKLEEQIKIPTRLTYRAVGSGTGQKEFLGKGIEGLPADQEYITPYNDFGSGDIPISNEDWLAMNEKGQGFVQLPFVLSAVSFFHSIPGVPGGAAGLNMTACLLSQIFQGTITVWDDPKIKEINPNLNVAENYPIWVGRRVLGSSSTYSITHYLYAQCPKKDDNPDGWPLDKVGKEIEWPESTNPCDGSGLMTNCLKDHEGAIGYIDSAHGHEEFLTEIRIKNFDENFLTSKEAGDPGVAAAAADTKKIPTSAEGDFADVAYYNMPGENTWPIALVSYIYIRKDLSHMSDPASRTLLKAFATALYDPNYIGLCSRFGHIPVPSKVKDIALAGIAGIDGGDGPEWMFETETQPGIGQGDYVISDRRQNFGLYEADNLYDDVKVLKDAMRELRIQAAELQLSMASTVATAGLVVFAGAVATLVLL